MAGSVEVEPFEPYVTVVDGFDVESGDDAWSVVLVLLYIYTVTCIHHTEIRTTASQTPPQVWVDGLVCVDNGGIP